MVLRAKIKKNIVDWNFTFERIYRSYKIKLTYLPNIASCLPRGKIGQNILVSLLGTCSSYLNSVSERKDDLINEDIFAAGHIVD